ncbi:MULTISPECIES: sugar transferase [Gordonia]|uniref:Sugar transferase n=1 Tax=Gordonia tangerina TaxID=2911060 RepID=A0ABS9DLX1_9ACTN|nr:sugar transferase [Gordonia tangerina]MCF3940161.1 sugar transferase [Gordonia tangerina]
MRLASQIAPSSWLARYLAVLAWTDLVVVIAAVLSAQWIRFGSNPDVGRYAVGGPQVMVVSLVLIVAWLVALRVYQTLDHKIIGAGAQEYSRVVSACFSVFGLLAILVLALRLDVSRGYFALALPLGTLGLLCSRWSWRRRLVRQRRRGANVERVLVVGEPGSVTHIVNRLRRSPELGFYVIGACLPVSDATARDFLHAGDGERIPVYGDYEDVPLAVSASGASRVAVTSAGAIGHEAMQQLSWDLQGMDVEMMVAPGVTDVAGPRIMVRPVAGLPLLYIDKPRYEGANRFRKAALDWVGAALILLLAAPLLVALAIAIKIDTSGPAFYHATRMGLNNKPFRMWKFRSMVVDADALKADLTARDEGAGALFKIRDDPRITRVGALIRRYSLDELPQLFNVLTGAMSLVGPRPPLPEEVEQYDGRVARRMLVKPGMTGLWQVSGRSDLTWEESVRLDLSYVENWSIMQDLVILWRTSRAVLSKDGAY